MNYQFSQTVSRIETAAGVEIRILVTDVGAADQRCETLQFARQPTAEELEAAIENKLRILNAPTI